MWSFLKSRSDAPQVTDQRQIDASYKYWRIQLMCTMYIGYAAFYFTRKSFNFIMPAMLSDLGLTMSDVGILGTLFYITYGCSKFISGMISDRSNPRYFMGLGLIMTGVLNIFFGLSSSLLMLGTLWILNAFFQGWGWPPCSKILTSWYSRSERGLVGNLEHFAQRRRRADPAAGGLYLAALQLALRHDHSRHHRRGARPADVLALARQAIHPGAAERRQMA
jgi:Sugar phosphate permease